MEEAGIHISALTQLSDPVYYRLRYKIQADNSKYEGRTESHEQLFFTCELGTTDDGECGGRWNQLLCYP